MLSVVGLALDLIGGAMLALGLFRHPQLLYPGELRSAEEATQDHCFGTVGFLFLASGFVLQALPYLGVHQSTKHGAVLLAGCATLGGGILVAWLSYGLTYFGFYARQRRFLFEHRDWEIRVVWTPKPLRFWRHERVHTGRRSTPG